MTTEEAVRLVFSVGDTRKQMAQIQLDAMKEGMRRAALIAKAESDKVCCEDPYAHYAIFSALDQLTEKDLEQPK